MFSAGLIHLGRFLIEPEKFGQSFTAEESPGSAAPAVERPGRSLAFLVDAIMGGIMRGTDPS